MAKEFSMRDYEELENVNIPKEQEEIMDIMCKAWEECRESDCTGCKDRPNREMRIMACTALKYSRLLIENGYKKTAVDAVEVVHAKWAWITDDDVMCTACGAINNTDDNADAGLGIWKFCPRCGAKMDKE